VSMRLQKSLSQGSASQARVGHFLKSIALACAVASAAGASAAESDPQALTEQALEPALEKARNTPDVEGSQQYTPPVLEAAKAAFVTNGIRLGQVISLLGPGWSYPTDVRANLTRWSFADGRELAVFSPTSLSTDTVLSTDLESPSRLWFTTNYLPAPAAKPVGTIKFVLAKDLVPPSAAILSEIDHPATVATAVHTDGRGGLLLLWRGGFFGYRNPAGKWWLGQWLGLLADGPTAERIQQLKSEIGRLEARCVPARGTTREEVERKFGLGRPTPIVISKFPAQAATNSPNRAYEFCTNGTLQVRYDETWRVSWAYYANPYGVNGLPLGATIPPEWELGGLEERLQQMKQIAADYEKRFDANPSGIAPSSLAAAGTNSFASKVIIDTHSGQYAEVDANREVVTSYDKDGRVLWSTNVVEGVTKLEGERATSLPHLSGRKIQGLLIDHGVLLVDLVRRYAVLDFKTGELKGIESNRRSEKETVLTERQQSYYVLGKVKTPGPQTYKNRITVLEALAAAGLPEHKKFAVRLTRADGRQFTIDPIKALSNPALDLEVFPGDEIHVPRQSYPWQR
jgi:hypothetical protein